MLWACTGNISRDIPPLMRSVPSRSLAVMHFPHCSSALEFLLDSTSIFRRVDYGRLGSAEMVLSYDYSAALVPLLAIDAGKADADTSQAVRKVLSQAQEFGLHALYTGDHLPKRAALLLSTSRPSIDEAWSHIESGASILDAPGFKEALSIDGPGSARIMLKNGSASRWLPRKLDMGFSRKDLVRFVSGAAAWTVADLDGPSGEGIVLHPWTDGKQSYMAQMFSALPAGEMKLSSVIPDTLDMVVCLPLKDCKAYNEAWKECLDVRADLSRYKGRLASLKRASGKNPEIWMAEQDLKEVARLDWDGHQVLLWRSARRSRASAAPAENPYPGFIPALFGEAFRIADEGFLAGRGNWTAAGSASDVAAWLDACKGKTAQGMPKKAKYYFRSGKFSLVADNNNIITNVN